MGDSPLTTILSLIPERVKSGIKAKPAQETTGTLVSLLLQQPGFLSRIENLCDTNVEGCSPDCDRAAEYKREGTKFFASGKYVEAAKSFTAALQFTDETTASGSSAASVLYANRAAAMLKLGHAQRCVEDASLAVDADPQYTKAWYRKACALQQLGDIGAAMASAQSALRILEQSECSSATALEELHALISNLSAPQGELGTGSHSQAQQEHGPSSRASRPGEENLGSCSSMDELLSVRASRAVLMNTPLEGRFLVAMEDFPRGTTVVCDEPVAWALRKRYRRRRCEWCVEELAEEGAAAVTCKAAPVPLFCSQRCRDQHQVQLGHEYRRPWPMVLSEEVVLAVRLAGLHKTLKDHNDDSNANSNSNLNSGPELELELESHVDALPADLRLDLAIMAVVGAACWRKSVSGIGVRVEGKDARRDRTDEDEEAEIQRFSSAVLENLARIRVNGVAIVDEDRSVDGDPEAHRVALAVYPVASMLNHSCSPSLSLRFSGKTLTASATREVLAGDDLCISYGPQQGPMPCRQRRGLLSSQYFFHCKCSACMDADVGEDAGERWYEAMACGASGCAGAVQNDGPAPLQCDVCGKQCDPSHASQAKAAVERGRKVMDSARRCAVEGNEDAALDALVCWKASAGSVLHKWHPVVGAAQDLLSRTLAQQGRFRAAREAAAASLESLQQRYPPDAPALAHATAWLVALVGAHGGNAEPIREQVQAAAQGLECHVGGSNAKVQALWQLERVVAAAEIGGEGGEGSVRAASAALLELL